jgi:hypothetical protein
MDIPPSRKRPFQDKEITFIEDAIKASGLTATELQWTAASVKFNNAVELQAVLYDCRGPLETSCWSVRRLAVVQEAQPCSCGAIVRESADGTFGSLKTAVAAALAELVRSRVLASMPEGSEPILKVRPANPAAAGENDFITQCVHP